MKGAQQIVFCRWNRWKFCHYLLSQFKSFSKQVWLSVFWSSTWLFNDQKRIKKGKWILRERIKIQSSFTHPHVTFYLSSVKHKIYFEMSFFFFFLLHTTEVNGQQFSECRLLCRRK